MPPQASVPISPNSTKRPKNYARAASPRRRFRCTIPLKQFALTAQLAVKANVIEMYDAGWRIEAVDVGEDSTSTDGVKAMPLTITIRKIF